ncbi:MAG: DUF3871 family protein, partial [Candidatus Sericytochromatia bacterium]
MELTKIRNEETLSHVPGVFKQIISPGLSETTQILTDTSFLDSNLDNRSTNFGIHEQVLHLPVILNDIKDPGLHESTNTLQKSPFIEANTEEVSLFHLKEKCVIPVFTKDNEITLSHQEFIE